MAAEELARRAVEALARRGQAVATAESCTGGLLGARITAVPGSSAVYPGGVISYSCAVKERVLGVDGAALQTLGAVSESVARQMAEGARRVLWADWGIGITGLAGPDGDGSGKPVGLVYLALAGPEGTACRECHFSGGRAAVRSAAADAALEMLLAALHA